MAFNINKLIIDRPIRGMMMSQTGDIFWSVNDFKDPRMSATVESQQAVDALNTPIMEFDRAKTVEFSATNAGFDLGLFAARAGLEKQNASEDKIIMVPAWDTLPGKSGTPIILNHNVSEAAAIPFIWALTKDGSTGVRYSRSETQVSATEFTVTISEGSTSVNLPSGITTETTFLIPYEYAANGDDKNGAIEVDYSSNNFPKAGTFVMNVLCHDICDSETEYLAWIIMENAKLSSEIDITLNPEMTDDFTIKAMPAYCSEDKRCFRIIVPEASAQ